MKRWSWLIPAWVILAIGVALVSLPSGMGSKGDAMLDRSAGVTEGAGGNGTLETAWFAMGCFWGPDGAFGVLPGVVRTRVGYAGGSTQHPTYYDLGGSAETVEVVYDPSVIGYEQLLDVFWENHEPYGLAYNGQYRSMLLVSTDEQQALAEASLERQAEQSGRRPTTQVVRLEQFTSAEDEHQKFRLQSEPELLDEIRGRFATFDAFVDSTLAARVNGFLGGYGTPRQLEEILPTLGLSNEAVATLRASVQQSPAPECGVAGI